MASVKIIIKGARQHNLKNIDLELPRNRLIVITGLSGSGKSSLAFDTIYAEGQRRYVESLSAYARQFLEQMDKPEVESIEGLSPAISIEQKAASKNPRSTVGTVTEVYDYLRLLFARVGKPYCYQCGRPIASQTIQQIVDRVLSLPEGTRINIMAPIVRGRKGVYRRELSEMNQRGFVRARVDGRWVELAEKVAMDKNKKHNIEIVVDRLSVKGAVAARLADSIETALKIADGLVLIEEVDGQEMVFSQKSACIECGVSYPELAPRMFSFNSPHGACPECGGLGSKSVIDPDLIVPDKSLSLQQGAIKPWDGKGSKDYSSLIKALAEHYNFSLSTPFKELTEHQRNAVLYGTNGEKIRFSYERAGKRYHYQGEFGGVVGEIESRYDETWSQKVLEEIEQYMSVRICAACGGARLRPESLAVKINGLCIADMTKLSVKEAMALFAKMELSEQESLIGARVLKEISDRLRFLSDVGLDYITLDRAASTLAGGEAQRIRLATQIGSGLVGVLYIMDEPSIGLHHRDNTRLLATLKKLRDLGNTVIVVEHDRETILSGDYVVDLGPGAGEAGGYLVAAGTPGEIIKNKKSLTGRYLSGEISIPVPQNRRPFSGKFFRVRGACENNLKSIDVRIPLGAFTCITGVSGSGKSTLLLDIIYRALANKLNRSNIRPGRFEAMEGFELLDKVIDIDQSPIGRTPRSNPATYTGVFTHIRELFSQVPEARKRGYKPGRFSFNVKGGRCEACEGDGMIKIEMHFLPDIYVTCEVCKGKRFNRETLEVKYKGCNIAEVLEMTAETALGFFENVPKVKQMLKTICDVGLGYIKLGQSATTLSGGEAQRVKLSKELSKRSTGKTFYILDEPTTGLHFADIQQLLNVLNRLADQGNTVVVIEHNPDVIKQADYIVDLGPEGGDEGGYIVAEGTPEGVANAESSYTGQFLKKILSPTRESWKKSSHSALKKSGKSLPYS